MSATMVMPQPRSGARTRMVGARVLQLHQREMFQYLIVRGEMIRIVGRWDHPKMTAMIYEDPVTGSTFLAKEVMQVPEKLADHRLEYSAQGGKLGPSKRINLAHYIYVD